MAAVIGSCAALLVVAGARAMRPRRARRPAATGHIRGGVDSAAHQPALASPARRRAFRLGLGAAVAASIFVLGPLLTAAIVSSRFAWRRLSPIRAARRRRSRIGADLPDAIEMFVHAVHAGLTPRQAIDRLARWAPPSVRPGFAAVTARLARGDSFAEALRALDDVLGSPAIVVSTLVGSADRDGLALAPVLEQLAAESRATRRRLDEAAARSLPVKLAFPLVVCTLPSFALLAIVPAVLAALSSLGDAW